MNGLSWSIGVLGVHEVAVPQAEARGPRTRDSGRPRLEGRAPDSGRPRLEGGAGDSGAGCVKTGAVKMI